MNGHCESLKPQVKNNLFDFHNQCWHEAGEDGTNIPGSKYVIYVLVFFLNNEQDTPIIQIYSVIEFYMFQASPLPIIRSFLLYLRHW